VREQNSTTLEEGVLVVGRNCLLRKGIARAVIEAAPGAKAIEVGSFDEAKAQLARESISAAFFDIDMNDLRGPSDLQKLRTDYPDLIVAVVGRDDKAEVVFRYLAAGVNGYIAVCCNQSEVEWAIQTIFRGAIYAPPTLLKSGIDFPYFGPELSALHLSMRDITKRQRDVLELLGGGCSNKEIARRLGMSPHTVKIHVGALLRYFSVRRRRDLCGATFGRSLRRRSSRANFHGHQVNAYFSNGTQGR
jgi:DNA-binding NarL/FixJ family response regulator